MWWVAYSLLFFSLDALATEATALHPTLEPLEHHHHHHHDHVPSADRSVSPKDTPSDHTEEAPTVPQAIYAAFQEIEALAARSAYNEAQQKAESLIPLLEGNPRGQALLLRNLATLYGAQKHYVKAAEALERALAFGTLAKGDALKALWERGQYYLAAEAYPKAEQAMTQWLDQTPDPSPESLIVMSYLKVRLTQYRDALALAEKAISLSPSPKPEWFQLALGLYREARDMDGCVRMLSKLINTSPENVLYWRQLIGVYQESGQEQKALAVRQLMYARNMLTRTDEIIGLVEVLRYRGLSARAAELLQDEIKKGHVQETDSALELLASAWTESHELPKAAIVLEKAISHVDKNEFRHRLGQIYSEMHQWQKARNILYQAVKKGKLNNPGGAWLLLGLAEYRLHAKEKAREAFVKAAEIPAFQKTAQQWLEHIDRQAGVQASSH